MTYRLIITYTNGKCREYPLDEGTFADLGQILSTSRLPGALTISTGLEQLTIITDNIASIAIKAAE